MIFKFDKENEKEIRFKIVELGEFTPISLSFEDVRKRRFENRLMIEELKDLDIL
jgi:hypothetical protein